MWNIDTPWFDLAMVMSIFAFGNALFGRFEEHKPRGRRVLKIALVSAIFVAVAASAGRAWAYALLSSPTARRGVGAPRVAPQARHQRLDGGTARQIFGARERSLSPWQVIAIRHSPFAIRCLP